MYATGSRYLIHGTPSLLGRLSKMRDKQTADISFKDKASGAWLCIAVLVASRVAFSLLNWDQEVKAQATHSGRSSRCLFASRSIHTSYPQLRLLPRKEGIIDYAAAEAQGCARQDYHREGASGHGFQGESMNARCMGHEASSAGRLAFKYIELTQADRQTGEHTAGV